MKNYFLSFITGLSVLITSSAQAEVVDRWEDQRTFGFSATNECYFRATDGTRFAPIDIYSGANKVATVDNLLTAANKINELIETGSCLRRANLPTCSLKSDSGLLSLEVNQIDYLTTVPSDIADASATIRYMDELARLRLCNRPTAQTCRITQEGDSFREFTLQFGDSKFEHLKYEQANSLLITLKRNALCSGAR